MAEGQFQRHRVLHEKGTPGTKLGTCVHEVNLECVGGLGVVGSGRAHVLRANVGVWLGGRDKCVCKGWKCACVCEDSNRFRVKCHSSTRARRRQEQLPAHLYGPQVRERCSPIPCFAGRGSGAADPQEGIGAPRVGQDDQGARHRADGGGIEPVQFGVASLHLELPQVPDQEQRHGAPAKIYRET